jgi:hypothetical protein
MHFKTLLALLVVFLAPNVSLAFEPAFEHQIGEWLVSDDGSVMRIALVPLEVEEKPSVFPQFAPIVFNQEHKPVAGMYRRSTIARDRWDGVKAGKDMDDYITVNEQNLHAGYFTMKGADGRPFLLVVPSTEKGQGFLLNALKSGEVRMGRSIHKTPSFSDAWAALLKNRPL